tara:strand:+ start:267 stop:596 length:330 start_codon:yes stop_codon:yes gene_type:complete
MALIKFDTIATTGSAIPMIVDMDVPVVSTDPAGTDSFSVNITTSVGPNTIDIVVTDAEANTDNILTTLNAALEAAIADPYAIPVVASIDHSGGYLEPEMLNVITGISVT